MEINKLKEELKDFIEKNTEEIEISITDIQNVDKDIESIKKFAYRKTVKNLLESLEIKHDLYFNTEEITHNLLNTEEFDTDLNFISLNINLETLIVYVFTEEGKIINLNFDDIKLLNEFVKLYRLKYLEEIYKSL